MCLIHNAKGPTPNPIKTDPSRTGLLRKRFLTDMSQRWDALRQAVIKLVVTDDAFAIAGRDDSPLQTNTRWAFENDEGKVKQFQQWFKSEVDNGVLAVQGHTGKPWTAAYVESAHRQGVLRAFTDLNKDKLNKSLDFYAGSKEQFLTSAFGQPEMVSKIKLLQTRAFEELKDVTATAAKDMNRILGAGLANGLGPREIARQMTKGIDGLEAKRARTIARTEIIHAHAEGQLDGFEALGVEEIGIMAEWMAEGDACPLCSSLAGVVLTVKEARGLLPRHPNCRCAFAPALVDRKETGQKRGQKLVEKAIAKSIEKEKPNSDNPRADSSWAGADKTIAKSREAQSSSELANAMPVDQFGARIGTQAAQINSAILQGGNEAMTAKEIAQRAGVTPARLQGHLASLQKKGLLEKVEGGYKIVGGVQPPPRGGTVAPPLPGAVSPGQVGGAKPKKEKAAPATPVGVATQPKTITFSGERTELTEKVWNAIGKDGIRDHKHAREVGKVFLEEFKKRKSPELAAVEKQMATMQVQIKDALMKRDAWTEADRVKYKELMQEGNALSAKLAKVQQSAQPDILAALREVRDFGYKEGQDKVMWESWDNYSEKDKAERQEHSKRINEDSGFLPHDWLKAIVKNNDRGSALWPIIDEDLEPSRRGRAHYSHYEWGVYVPAKDGTRAFSREYIKECVVHELTHAAEKTVPGMLKVQMDFLYSRVKPGEQQTQVAGCRADEIGYKDDFLDHYMGKPYNGKASELMTMGVERLLYGSPGAVPYLSKDPDYFNFVLGVLVGM